MDLKVHNSDGSESSSTVSVSETSFDAPYNEPMVHQVVVSYQAGQRRGTRAQKNRSAVSGGGAKPFRQKGTGRARAGTSRSPIWKGGGKIFPATTRDFSKKVNRKMYRGAMRAILSELHRSGRLKVVDDFSVDQPKTKALAAMLAPLAGSNALVVSEAADEALRLSARNLPMVSVCASAEIDPLSLVRHENVVMTVGAVQKIEEWLQ